MDHYHIITVILHGNNHHCVPHR